MSGSLPTGKRVLTPRPCELLAFIFRRPLFSGRPNLVPILTVTCGRISMLFLSLMAWRVFW